MEHQDDNALRIRFSGGRFDAGIVPTNVLASLDHLAKLIAETAWQEYSAERGSKRGKGRFNEAMALGLAKIEAGSTVATICPMPSYDSLPGFDLFELWRQRGVEKVHSAVAAAEHNDDPTEVLEPKLLAMFNDIVPDLNVGETVGFPATVGESAEYASLTYDARERIVDASKSTTLVKPGEVYAYVTEINKRTRRFEIKAAGGSLHRNIAYQPTDFNTLHDSWASYRRELGVGNPVRIVGDLELTHQGQIRGVKSVATVQEIDPLDVRARLLHISGLQDGWYDGKGSRYSRAYLDSLADRFNDWYPSDLPNPAIFPHADGTIGCEWSLNKGECNLVVNPETDTGDWIDFNLDDDDDSVERNLNLLNQSDWDWLGQRVAERAVDEQP